MALEHIVTFRRVFEKRYVARNDASNSLTILLILLFVGSALGAPTSVNFGGLILSISDSSTAQVFHIVDQLSEWDQYAHKQYVRWSAKALQLNQEDRELLQKHAALRRKRGWGHGFEQAFLVNESIRDAADNAVAAHLLTDEEAVTERDILLHFAPKLAGLLEERHGQIQAFTSQLEAAKARLAGIIAQVQRFAQSDKPVAVTVFLVANTEDQSGGGEANGGRLVVEVPSADPMGFLLHEAVHAILAPRWAEVKSKADAAGINGEVLNEGIAYAVAPGMTDDIGQKDLLVEQLVRYLMTRKSPADTYVQFYMVAVVIRPLLRASLTKGEAIQEFLPKATAKWRDISSH